MTVRVRFAPSPTGSVHIGSLRTALYNYLYARQQGGKYIIRVEDTDQTRLIETAVEGMIRSMEWAGIEHDEGPYILNHREISQKGDYGPYIQSERLDIYKKYAEELLEKGHAYYCFCSRERLETLREEQKARGLTTRYDGHCRSIPLEEARKRVENGEDHVLRLKLPLNRDISFEDVVRGKVTFNTSDLDDQVLIKNDGFPTYHFAVVVDDHLMAITHIIRGEEWLSSTPKHVLLYEAFGWEAPEYVHLPNILNADKKKLSKRQGDVSVEDFKRKGYLPEALINYIALLGWAPEEEREIFSLEELIEAFSLERVSKSGGVFDIHKLNWMNNLYIRQADDERLSALAMRHLLIEGILKDEEIFAYTPWVKRIVALEKEKLEYMQQITGYVKAFMSEEIQVSEPEAQEVLKAPHVKALLVAFEARLRALESFDGGSIKGVIKSLQKDLGVKGKDLFMPLRVGVTGNVHGSDLVETIGILGIDRVSKRLDTIINTL
ncbi:MAG: glutamate--tRNA ligase [delta proteobacterium ML8_F1]|nr:MAG: glutamate--tRNA ligase [delta proteobacterium ML8_F1]